MFDVKTKVTDYMSIVLTHSCTRKCRFCIDKYRGNNLYISDEHFLNAIAFAKTHHMKDILLIGGEPTLHPKVVEYATIVKDNGFRLIMTTNCDRPEVLYTLDPIVDCFNFSHYGQPMPAADRFHHADITINKLLIKGGIDSKKKLDNFIDKFGKDYYLKFSTMAHANQWTEDNQTYFVDDLQGESLFMFDEVPGIMYRGCVIKRYDKTIYNSDVTQQSYKCLVNGKIAKNWEM